MTITRSTQNVPIQDDDFRWGAPSEWCALPTQVHYHGNILMTLLPIYTENVPIQDDDIRWGAPSEWCALPTHVYYHGNAMHDIHTKNVPIQDDDFPIQDDDIRWGAPSEWCALPTPVHYHGNILMTYIYRLFQYRTTRVVCPPAGLHTPYKI